MTTKVASRFLLPLELFLGLTMVSWALSGGLARGYLYRLLERDGANLTWLVVLGVVGGLQMGWAMFEWALGREWTLWTLKLWPPSVHQSASLRATCAFFAGCVWLYICKLVLDGEGMQSVTVLAILAPASFLFCCWVFVENLKVRCALDPQISTSTLRFDR